MFVDLGSIGDSDRSSWRVLDCPDEILGVLLVLSKRCVDRTIGRVLNKRQASSSVSVTTTVAPCFTFSNEMV